MRPVGSTPRSRSRRAISALPIVLMRELAQPVISSAPSAPSAPRTPRAPAANLGDRSLRRMARGQAERLVAVAWVFLYIFDLMTAAPPSPRGRACRRPAEE